MPVRNEAYISDSFILRPVKLLCWLTVLVIVHEYETFFDNKA